MNLEFIKTKATNHTESQLTAVVLGCDIGVLTLIVGYYWIFIMGYYYWILSDVLILIHRTRSLSQFQITLMAPGIKWNY